MKIHPQIFLLIFCAIFAVSSGASGQARSAPAPVQEQTAAKTDKDSAADEENRQLPSDDVLISAVKRNFATRFRVSLTEKDKQAVAINADDAEKFAEFLKQENAGFARLYDAAACEMNQRILNVADQCPPNMLGRGISYSFRKKKYQSAMFSDLRFHKDTLHVTGLNVLGFLTNLGAAPLDGLSLQSAGIKEMAEFQPVDNLETIRRQFHWAAKGFQVGDFFYKNALPLRENDTYALRAIAFDGKVVGRFGRFKINVLDQDKRQDVIVVFRVIRRHANGSVSLLWRELRRTDAPKLEFPKQKDKK